MATYRGDKIPLCYATCSIGHLPSHDLPTKLAAISSAGFEAIELSMPDILSYGKQISGKDIDPKDYGMLKQVGLNIRRLCDQHHLKILMLQPFANFEGWPANSDERRDAFERAEGWSQIMEAVGTDMLQIGSSDAPNITSSLSQHASDLASLADIFAKRNQRIAYENWCWATHAPDWKDVWEIVQLADRPNLGLCLDTFQSAGGEWGDPRSVSGLADNNGKLSKDEVEQRWKASLQKLVKAVPKDKIFLLQISDAYRMHTPIKDEVDGHGLRPRGQWSHDHRPMPYDGGYLPVEGFAKVVLETGFRGWFSMEVFDAREGEKHGDDLEVIAKKAMGSVRKLLGECERQEL